MRERLGVGKSADSKSHFGSPDGEKWEFLLPDFFCLGGALRKGES